MTADEWETCSEPARLLAAVADRATDRRRRLFAAACGRLVWDRLPFDACRSAVILGEQYADGLAVGSDLAAALRGLNRQLAAEHGHRARLAHAAALLLRPRFTRTHAEAALRLAWVGRDRSAAAQGAVLRDVFDVLGRRRPVRLPPALLDCVRAIYDARRFDDLPPLADALAAAGGLDRDVLAHLRGPGPHVRGCWAVDQLLGLE